MSRYEKDFEVTGPARLSLNELLVLLGDMDGDEPRSREDAIACYLSGAEGSDQAAKLLGGAFAPGAGGLTNDQGD